MLLIIQLLFIFAVIAFVFPFLTSGLGFAPSTDQAVRQMIKRAGIKPGDKAVDVGSGDGRIVIALAQAGAEAHGYEINPILVWTSRFAIWRKGLRGKAFIHQKSLWTIRFSDYDVITLFAVGPLMKRLEKRLKTETKPGTRIIVNKFKLPSWEPAARDGNIFVYIRHM